MTPCVILLRFIHVVVCTKVYCFYVAENYPIIAQDILYLFGHSPVDGHLDCFQFLGSSVATEQSFPNSEEVKL